jgi:methyl-accepting chemotaxis protein
MQRDAGAAPVKAAGATMNDIIESVWNPAAESISDFTTASREQVQGINQIAGANTGLDQSTQQSDHFISERTHGYE